MFQEVTVPWNSTYKQHTPTHYTISLEILFGFYRSQNKTKINMEIVPPRPKTLRPHSPINIPADMQ